MSEDAPFKDGAKLIAAFNMVDKLNSAIMSNLCSSCKMLILITKKAIS